MAPESAAPSARAAAGGPLLRNITLFDALRLRHIELPAVHLHVLSTLLDTCLHLMLVHVMYGLL